MFFLSTVSLLYNWYNVFYDTKRNKKTSDFWRRETTLWFSHTQMSFMWPLRLKLNFFHQTNIFMWFLDPKKPLKVVSFIVLTFLVFLLNFSYLVIDPKKHFLEKSLPNRPLWKPQPGFFLSNLDMCTKKMVYNLFGCEFFHRGFLRPLTITWT